MASAKSLPRAHLFSCRQHLSLWYEKEHCTADSKCSVTKKCLFSRRSPLTGIPEAFNNADVPWREKHK